ncbi:orotate phosphoribosyltransferase [Methylobacterium symbioticum]|uniref:Orotate phosphoribosyltransferase n=1 Tax=Methylobacterium symbioticum TaxID=2584084 RepID=A0A509EGX4_9HYPH|nr:orotate phosphoribosyltransferase [Methylobacterium symbioticum]VUD72699.1 Orotate phosphoribosyltransferase [Methylobacterium symbioticum]
MQTTILSAATSAVVAEALTDLGAVRVAGGQPFIYTSGWASPVYVDTRLLMSDVDARTRVMDIAARHLQARVAELDAVVGAESTGIAFGAWIAERLGLPFLYLRKKPMGWGSAARLEGRLPEGARALFVDDVTTDGRSKIAAAAALRQSGTRIADVLVILDYGIYPGSAERLAEQGLTLHALTGWPALSAALRTRAAVAPEALANLDAFTADPVAWSVANGGVGA